jgi:hypothetical protein
MSMTATIPDALKCTCGQTPHADYCNDASVYAELLGLLDDDAVSIILGEIEGARGALDETLPYMLEVMGRDGLTPISEEVVRREIRRREHAKVLTDGKALHEEEN